MVHVFVSQSSFLSVAIKFPIQQPLFLVNLSLGKKSMQEVHSEVYL
jgi:hypothetical protein